MVSDAQKKATSKFERENYDKFCLRLRPKGKRDKIALYAKSKGYKSLNEYITDLIEKDMPEE